MWADNMAASLQHTHTHTHTPLQWVGTECVTECVSVYPCVIVSMSEYVTEILSDITAYVCHGEPDVFSVSAPSICRALKSGAAGIWRSAGFLTDMGSLGQDA